MRLSLKSAMASQRALFKICRLLKLDKLRIKMVYYTGYLNKSVGNSNNMIINPEKEMSTFE